MKHVSSPTQSHYYEIMAPFMEAPASLFFGSGVAPMEPHNHNPHVAP